MSRDLRNHKTFCRIRHFLKKVFAYYMKLYPEEKIKSFYDLMMKMSCSTWRLTRSLASSETEQFLRLSIRKNTNSIITQNKNGGIILRLLPLFLCRENFYVLPSH